MYNQFKTTWLLGGLAAAARTFIVNPPAGLSLTIRLGEMGRMR